MGYFNALGPLTFDWNAPDLQTTQLDPATLGLINQMAAEGNQSQAQLITQEMAGVAPTMPTATGGQTAIQQGSLGGPQNAATTQALNDRANRMYASAYNQMLQGAVTAAPSMQARLMNQATSSLGQQQNVTNALSAQQMQAAINSEQMRAQVIGSLFGGLGKAGGAYAGSKADQSQGYDMSQVPDYSGGTGQNYASGYYSADPSSPNFNGPQQQGAASGQQGLGVPTINGFGQGISYQGGG